MKRAILYSLLALTLFLSFSIARPLEDDESLYLLAGMSILDTTLHPFTLEQTQSTHNPFTYIMGSPLAPTLHALAYLLGGTLATRALTSMFVLLAIIITWKSHYKDKPHYILLLAALPGTILIASDAYLDALALLFLTLSLHEYRAQRMVTSGILAALAMISKYILIIPFVLFFCYLLYTPQTRANARTWALGAAPVCAAYLLLMHELIIPVSQFILGAKTDVPTPGALPSFLNQAVLALPILSIIVLAQTLAQPLMKRKHASVRSLDSARTSAHTPEHLAEHPPERSAEEAPSIAGLFISAGVLAYHFLTLDSLAIIRHAPYAEFAATFTKLALHPLLITAIIIAGPLLALDTLDRHADHTQSAGALINLTGTILTRYPYQHALATNETFSTSSHLQGMSYFDYDQDGMSTLDDYERALLDGHFTYAVTRNTQQSDLERYTRISALIRDTYCPYHTTDTLSIYTPCKSLNSSSA